MPPRVKITKDDIIKTALELTRRSGVGAINARDVAAALNCSTQPIFSNFATMAELQQSVIEVAYRIYLDFIKTEANSGKYPPYKAYGMAYVGFAEAERELFKLLFMRDRCGEDLSPAEDFESSVEMIMSANDIDREHAMLMHFEIWSAVHGIAVMIATSFLPLETELISNVLSDIYHGVCARHTRGEK